MSGILMSSDRESFNKTALSRKTKTLRHPAQFQATIGDTDSFLLQKVFKNSQTYVIGGDSLKITDFVQTDILNIVKHFLLKR